MEAIAHHDLQQKTPCPENPVPAVQEALCPGDNLRGSFCYADRLSLQVLHLDEFGEIGRAIVRQR